MRLQRKNIFQTQEVNKIKEGKNEYEKNYSDINQSFFDNRKY